MCRLLSLLIFGESTVPMARRRCSFNYLFAVRQQRSNCQIGVTAGAILDGRVQTTSLRRRGRPNQVIVLRRQHRSLFFCCAPASHQPIAWIGSDFACRSGNFAGSSFWPASVYPLLQIPTLSASLFFFPLPDTIIMISEGRFCTFKL